MPRCSASACALCSAALLMLREPPSLARSGSYVRDLRNVLNDLWQVARSRAGILALLIVFLPIGTGAASNLWAAVADDWHASAPTPWRWSPACSGASCRWRVA